MSPRSRTLDLFTRTWSAEPRFLVRAPGRVNLIGEHTDYNDGFALPMAIDRDTWIALRPTAERRVRLWSVHHAEMGEFSLDEITRGEGWLEYPKGVAWALAESGREVGGWDGVVLGEVPLGAGLSSSASFELALARAFACVSDFAWAPEEMARVGQRAENGWVGVNCGIMDQMISAVGREGEAVLIDCRDVSHGAVPLPEGIAVAILDTDTRRGLVDSAYNERREQCEAGARFFGVSALRDVSPRMFVERADELEETTRRRVRHVVTENVRTVQAAAAMRGGDLDRLGELIDAGHVSLRDDFEVSSPELDAIVEAARAHPACRGARMTGAGFGGCAVALVDEGAAEDFAATVARDYAARTSRTPRILVCRAVGGAEAIPL